MSFKCLKSLGFQTDVLGHGSARINSKVRAQELGGSYLLTIWRPPWRPDLNTRVRMKVRLKGLCSGSVNMYVGVGFHSDSS